MLCLRFAFSCKRKEKRCAWVNSCSENLLFGWKKLQWYHETDIRSEEIVTESLLMSRNSLLISANGFLFIISSLMPTNALKCFSISQAECHKLLHETTTVWWQGWANKKLHYCDQLSAKKSRKFVNVHLSNFPDAFQNNDVKLKRQITQKRKYCYDLLTHAIPKHDFLTSAEHKRRYIEKCFSVLFFFARFISHWLLLPAQRQHK